MSNLQALLVIIVTINTLSLLLHFAFIGNATAALIVLFSFGLFGIVIILLRGSHE